MTISSGCELCVFSNLHTKAEPRSGLGGPWPLPKKKKKKSIRVCRKNIWASLILDPPPPYPFLNYSPRPCFSFRPYVLQIKQKADPLHLNTQVLTLTTKFLSLSLSLYLKKPTHWPTESLIPFTYYSFVLSSLIHFHLHWYRYLPAPKTPVLYPHSPKKKKIPDQFFLSSLALVLELGDYLVSFLLFLKH